MNIARNSAAKLISSLLVMWVIGSLFWSTDCVAAAKPKTKGKSKAPSFDATPQSLEPLEIHHEPGNKTKYLFNDGRPFAIIFSGGARYAAQLETNLFVALAERDLGDKVRVQALRTRFAHAGTETMWLGSDVPVAVAQAAILAVLKGTNPPVKVMYREDDDVGTPEAQQVFFGDVGPWRNRTPTPAGVLRALTRTNLTPEQFRRTLLGPAFHVISPAYAALSKPEVTPQGVPTGMTLIPSGPFTMSGLNRQGGAAPEQVVNVNAFFVDRFEVTRKQYRTVQFWAAQKDREFGEQLSFIEGRGPYHPVDVSKWSMVVKWCNARSEMEGLEPVYYADTHHKTVLRTQEIELSDAHVKWEANGYRLPTEAEWEKAARGGAKGRRYPWGDTITHSQANCRVLPRGVAGPRQVGLHPVWGIIEQPFDPFQPNTSPVGWFPPNGYGLFDVIGNAAEWCWDPWSLKRPHPGTSGRDAHNPDAVGSRVLRGGDCFTTDPLISRAWSADDSLLVRGFRCVRRAQ